MSRLFSPHDPVSVSHSLLLSPPWGRPAARGGRCCRGVIIPPQPLDNTGLR